MIVPSSSCSPRLVDPPAVLITTCGERPLRVHLTVPCVPAGETGANHVAVLHAATHQNFTRLHSWQKQEKGMYSSFFRIRTCVGRVILSTRLQSLRGASL